MATTPWSVRISVLAGKQVLETGSGSGGDDDTTNNLFGSETRCAHCNAQQMGLAMQLNNPAQ